MIELGVVFGAIFLIWLVVGIGRLAVQVLRQSKTDGQGRERMVMAIAALCGMIGFLAHGVIDFGWRLPANLVYAVTLLGIVVVTLDQDGAVQARRSTQDAK